MPLELTINPLDPASLRQAAQKVRAYKARFEEKQIEFVRRLAEQGVEVAKARFDAALAGYDGDQTEIQVEVKQDGRAAEIVASGRTVAFLEFGAGVTHPEHSSGLFQHGTYGKGYGQRRVWGFYPGGDRTRRAVLTTGNDPAEAMPEAIRHMAEICADTAREVFGGD